MNAGEISFGARVPNWLGDAILAVPAVTSLVECSRRERVLVLASTSSADVFARVPGTVVYAIRRPGGGLVDSLSAVLRGSSILRALHPVMIFSFTRSFTSALTCSLGRVPRRIGFADSMARHFYTDRVGRAHTGDTHLVDSYCGLVESMGFPVLDRNPRIKPTAEDIGRGKQILQRYDLDAKAYVCLFPGARYGPAKRWEPSRFGLLADLVVGRLQKEIVLLGTKQDNAACEAVRRATKSECLDLCGRLDFPSLISLLASSYAAVSNDSGGMHLAAALGVPTVGLFFSSDPAWTGPRSTNAKALYNRIDCSPCFERDCDRGHPCTRSISVDQVADALKEVTEVAI
jgi:heptosyltransferase-2